MSCFLVRNREFRILNLNEVLFEQHNRTAGGIYDGIRVQKVNFVGNRKCQYKFNSPQVPWNFPPHKKNSSILITVWSFYSQSEIF